MRILGLIKGLRYLPRLARLSMAYEDAGDDVAQGRFADAEKKLLLAYDLRPPDLDMPPYIDLLMALVSLRLGHAGVAADLARGAARWLGVTWAYANARERAYLKYFARLVYEAARRMEGTPMTIDVGVQFDDIDVTKVRASLRSKFDIAALERHAAASLN